VLAITACLVASGGEVRGGHTVLGIECESLRSSRAVFVSPILQAILSQFRANFYSSMLKAGGEARTILLLVLFIANLGSAQRLEPRPPCPIEDLEVR
jgi:hypothetical protein